jgi:hypothetical protein
MLHAMYSQPWIAASHAIDDALGPIVDYRAQKPQGKGNCTTRSTREMLRDILPGPIFAHLHAHVSNPEICDPADVMAALQMRRNALEAYIRMQRQQEAARPEGQVDGEQPVEGQRASVEAPEPPCGSFAQSVRKSPPGGPSSAQRG